MVDCEQYRQRLLEDGPGVLAGDPALREHVNGCADCARLVAELRRLDAELGKLSAFDAPEVVVAGALQAAKREPTWSASEPSGQGIARRWAHALAACVILLAGIGLSEQLVDIGEQLRGIGGLASRSESAADWSARGPTAAAHVDEGKAVAQAAPPPPAVLAKRGAADHGEPRETSTFADLGFATGEALQDKDRARDAESRYRQVLRSPRPAAPMEESVDELATAEQPTAPSQPMPQSTTVSGMDAPLGYADALENEPAPATPVGSVYGGRLDSLSALKQSAGGAATPAKEGLVMPADASVESLSLVGAEQEMGQDSKAERASAGQLALRRQAQIPAASDARSQPSRPPPPSSRSANERVRRQPGAGGKVAAPAGQSHAKPAVSPGAAGGPEQAALHFLAERDITTGQVFQAATGYWANTYLPGDPAMRLLEARLRSSWDAGAPSGGSLSPAHLQETARPNWQPFDTPATSALAVYLHADKSGVEGPARLLLQVGLKASERQSGLRPTMNVGVVLNLGAKPDTRIAVRMRALLSALNRARQPGDRFSLTVAGPQGGLVVPSAEFREGSLQVALRKVLRPADGGGPGVPLAEAMSIAMTEVRAADDPGAPLGASLVLLATATPLTADLGQLETLAHTGAVAGVTTSAVALGPDASLAELDRLVLAGQGQRRILGKVSDAVPAVDQELYAASRAVARAVRLRIRLQPGVQLIRVLGSQRLAEPQVRRVREAERSIDQRLARNLGIRADRGQDEEGIQIVIPSFYAGDAHVVLLDVVAPGPGPVADVTVRYKDLVHLRNGVARAQLALPQGLRPRGPLERNVLKNLVARRLAQAAEQAGVALRRRDVAGARQVLAAQRELLQGLQQAVSGWVDDPELERDERLLAGYIALLESPLLARRDAPDVLADSLGLAAFRRLVPAAPKGKSPP